ncbi:MAG: hypothetical protein R8M46_02920 [Ghiorsea sp.]
MNIKNNKHIPFSALLLLMLTPILAGCVSTAKEPVTAAQEEYKLVSIEQDYAPVPQEVPKVVAPQVKEAKPEPAIYSFKAKNIKLRQALSMFSASYGLNIVIDPKVDGNINVNFNHVTFEQALDALMDSVGLFWQKRNNVVYVQDTHTQLFQVDYIRLTRGGSGSSMAQVMSSGDGGGKVGSVSISNEDQVRFWAELETQVKTLLSDDGRIVINRLSGTIQVTDNHKHVLEVESYIHNIQSALHRQVEIVARIVEVTMSDDKNLGVDWTRLASSGLINSNVALNTALATASTGTLSSVTATLTGQNNTATDQVSTVINALKEQGNVRMISQPRLMMLNNQSSLIKVGTDQPFFSQTTTPGTGGSAATVTESVRVVTVGLVLAVTTQISADGWVMLDASPIITRLVGTATSPGGSTAPILDIKQASTLVRLRDGETVVIGGLIQDETTENERKVPFLGDIPLLGGLFTGSFKHKKRSELVIFLTPKIKSELNANFPI